MKKLLALTVAVMILILSPISSFAGTASKTSVTKVTNIKVTKSSSEEKVLIYTPTYKGYKVSVLTSPYRYVIDLPNNVLSGSLKNAVKANGIYVNKIRFSQYTKNTVRIVIDANCKLKYTIEAKTGVLTFIVKKPYKVFEILCGFYF
jgi:hypothetical protein